MNQVNWVAIIGAVAAGMLSIITAVTGNKNQEQTHDRIDTVEADIMQKTTVQAHIDNFDEWQKQQDARIETLEKGHDLHLHLDDESFDIEEGDG